MNNKYYFKDDTKLTNYFLCDIVIDNIKFSSGEAAYHYQKFKDKDIKKLILKLSPDEAKHVSRKLSRFIRDDWESVKYDSMKKVVMEKFKQNKDCLEELLNTGSMELIEDTTGWHDNTWGECSCDDCKNLKHQNLLGKILMEVREELKFIPRDDLSKQVQNSLNVSTTLNLLNNCKGMAKNDDWILHSICVGNTAGVIAKALNLDEEYEKVLGYIHDIGKRFGLNSHEGVIPHAINGYNYLKKLGYSEEYAGICIKHSFLNNDINCLANDRDYTDSLNENYNFIKNYLLKEYTIYEKIINLCDLMCTTKLQTVEKRMIDLLLRHGVYKNTHYHLIETLKLKEYFDDLLGYNLYDLFPEIKENL